MERDDERFPGHDPRYADLTEADLPAGECLKDTVERFLPCWKETIAPDVASGKRVLIASHGNSLRALVKYLDDVSDDDIVGLNIPTGIPLVYELDDDPDPDPKLLLGRSRPSKESYHCRRFSTRQEKLRKNAKTQRRKDAK